jgi:hypothetical protein
MTWSTSVAKSRVWTVQIGLIEIQSVLAAPARVTLPALRRRRTTVATVPHRTRTTRPARVQGSVRRACWLFCTMSVGSRGSPRAAHPPAAPAAHYSPLAIAPPHVAVLFAPCRAPCRAVELTGPSCTALPPVPGYKSLPFAPSRARHRGPPRPPLPPPTSTLLRSCTSPSEHA